MNTFKSVITLLLAAVSINTYADSLIITNAKIINPAGDIHPRSGYIIIHQDKIVKIGYGDVNPAQKNAHFYDAKGQYIIPGLIDAHVHIDTVSGVDDSNAEKYSDLIADYRKQLPRSFLYFGYTTIIDLFSADNDLIQKFRSSPLHPDLFTTGGGISMLGGYPVNALPTAEQYKIMPNFLYPENSKNSYDKAPLAHQSPEAIIQRIVAAHAVCVKILYESGFGPDRNLPLPDLSVVRRIKKLAHLNHLPVAMHANSYKAVRFALDSGTDILAHGLWNWNEYNMQPGLPAPIKNELDQIVSRHVGMEPTMQVINGLLALSDRNFLHDEHLKYVVPASLLAWYQTDDGQWYAKLGSPKNDPVPNRFTVIQSQEKRIVTYLQSRHAKLLFGSDTPSGPTYANPPGYNGYLEMRAWNQAGVSLTEILRAATVRNAKEFHLDKAYGSIAPGRYANLVILKRNPLTDISAYDSISAVIVHGTIHDRNSLSAAQN